MLFVEKALVVKLCGGGGTRNLHICNCALNPSSLCVLTFADVDRATQTHEIKAWRDHRISNPGAMDDSVPATGGVACQQAVEEPDELSGVCFFHHSLNRDK